MWLRDSLGLAKPAIALTISLGAGATVPARCLLPQPAAFSTPLRAGAERTVLVQCRDAFGNPAPRGRDQVAMLTLTLTLTLAVALTLALTLPRRQLREREQGVVDKRELLALEEERKRAVADRLQAIH